MKRVIAYIDGFNLYYGLRSNKWKRFYWLNLQKMVGHLLKPDQELVYTKYFTSIVNRPERKYKRQAVFLEALRTLPDFDIHFGHFLGETMTCRHCGHTYLTHHEKMTDVNIAVELMLDAFQDRFDVALLVTADSDLVGPIKAVKQLSKQKRVVVAFPPKRYSNALKQTANAYTNIGRNVLAKSVFPDRVVKPDSYVLVRPNEWR